MLQPSGLLPCSRCSGRCRHNCFPVRRWLRGLGFVNLFGAVGGFIAPILRVKAETLFASDAAGLLTLAAVAVIGSLIIFTLRVNRTVAQTDVAHH
ncbi:hypothetical protein HMVEC_460174 [Escherichia coli]|nr:hypothetical protein HMVEC_460174 [Escherichia coli]